MHGELSRQNMRHFDVSTPAVLFQVSDYPFQHGSLGVIRSLGRLGVRTCLVARNRLAPHALSRYLTRQYRHDSLGASDAAETVAKLKEIARAAGGPAVLIPIDDEAAILVARHAMDLQGDFLLPQVGPAVVETLASKRGLYEACVRHGIPAPATIYADSRSEALQFAASARFPLVVKNSEPWHRLRRPAVGSTTVVRDGAEFTALARDWPENPKVIIQEYLPSEHCEDWIVHMYLDSASQALVAFSGRKYRSWPPGAGVTTRAAAQSNAELLGLARTLCAAVGYCGIVDMDWRFDRRDRRFKLVDFNPRVGANFRLFETAAGIDVVRAQYLDLTGQEVPVAPNDDSRQFCVENLDFVSRLAGPGGPAPAAGDGRRTTEYAWFAIDDPMPFLAMWLRFGGLGVRRMARRAWRALTARHGAAETGSKPAPGLHDV
jgi:predicted ATP-grasp superfamily ATP-dependent carboligase